MVQFVLLWKGPLKFWWHPLGWRRGIESKFDLWRMEMQIIELTHVLCDSNLFFDALFVHYHICYFLRSIRNEVTKVSGFDIIFQAFKELVAHINHTHMLQH